MGHKTITISNIIHSDLNKVWSYYTEPSHIVNWNFAHPSWHCPSASNDLTVGGKYHARMEAKDGSFGFDFDAIYSKIIPLEYFEYEFGGRKASVHFEVIDESTKVIINFDPEEENDIQMQRDGWQAILDNFKKYTENN